MIGDDENLEVECTTLFSKARAEMEAKEPDLALVADLLYESVESEENPQAAYALATWFINGRFFAQDFESAAKFLKIAASKNVPEALMELAKCYENGNGVKQNPRLSFENYLKGAIHGNLECIFEVGRCYYYGIGVERDHAIADIWLNGSKSAGTFVDEFDADT